MFKLNDGQLYPQTKSNKCVVSACFSKRLHGLARHGGHLAQGAACTQRLENDLQTARNSKLFQTSLDRVEPRWINLISDAQP